LKDARHIYDARFQRYAVPSGVMLGSSQPEQFTLMADLLKKFGALPADYDPSHVVTDRFIAEINQFDKGAIIAQAKSWDGK
jgi:NitT/TauT family transport system substrate-binding protein